MLQSKKPTSCCSLAPGVGLCLTRKCRFNPKSEIQIAKMLQDVGAEMNRKNRSHTQSGLVRFFQFIYAQQIAADWPFEFRISGLTNGGKMPPLPAGSSRT